MLDGSGGGAGGWFVDIIRGKMGEIAFGAVLGWVIRLLLSPPDHWLEALRAAALAITLGVVFAEPVALLAQQSLGLEMDLRASAAAAIAVGGEKAIRAAFTWIALRIGRKGAGDG